MPASPSVMTTRRGEFRRLYRELRRRPALFARTPVLFCEGDSWFSTPLAMNLLDWLVYPTPADEARGVPLAGAGGLFFRAEDSGDLATGMFAPRALADLAGWYGAFEFDLVLVSAGGNDFVGAFLARLFARAQPTTPEAALARVEASGRFEQVRAAYARMIARFRALRPGTPILAHSYDYPQRLGVPARLTVENVGLAALLQDRLGPWIAQPMARALPQPQAQRRFAALLIDAFVERVLEPLRREHAGFHYADLRGTLASPGLWFDEMHPTGAGFHALAAKLRPAIRRLLPEQKRG